jgi:hypothetical protein
MARTSDLVQRLQTARQDLALSQEIARLDRFDLLILDDISYVRKDQAKTSALFELIAARCERRSIMITANQPFSGWDAIFPDRAMTVAATDRLVHHGTLFEMNVESYGAPRSPQRPRSAATAMSLKPPIHKTRSLRHRYLIKLRQRGTLRIRHRHPPAMSRDLTNDAALQVGAALQEGADRRCCRILALADSHYTASLRKRGSLLIWLDKDMTWLAA